MDIAAIFDGNLDPYILCKSAKPLLLRVFLYEITQFLCHCSKENFTDNLSFVLSIEYSGVNTTTYWCTYFRTYHMFGYFTASLLEINCVIKELNILQNFICKDIIINLPKIKFYGKLGNISIWNWDTTLWFSNKLEFNWLSARYPKFRYFIILKTK